MSTGESHLVTAESTQQHLNYQLRVS